MAEDKASLSPKPALERKRRHRRAIMVLAMYSAKRSVMAQLRAALVFHLAPIEAHFGMVDDRGVLLSERGGGRDVYLSAAWL